MCQPGHWGLPQLRAVAQLKGVWFLYASDSWPQMNGARLSSVIKYLMKAHCMSRGVQKAFKWHLPCIRQFILVVSNPSSNTQGSPCPHLIKEQTKVKQFSQNHTPTKKGRTKFRPNSISHQLQVLPEYHMVTLLTHSPIYSFSQSANVLDSLLQTEGMKKVTDKFSVEDPSPGIRGSLWRWSSLGGFRKLSLTRVIKQKSWYPFI